MGINKNFKKIFSRIFPIFKKIEEMESETHYIKRNIDSLYNLLDGHDSLFLNICDADDPKEKDCPLDLGE